MEKFARRPAVEEKSPGRGILLGTDGRRQTADGRRQTAGGRRQAAGDIGPPVERGIGQDGALTAHLFGLREAVRLSTSEGTPSAPQEPR